MAGTEHWLAAAISCTLYLHMLYESGDSWGLPTCG